MRKLAFSLALVGILGAVAAAQPAANQMNNYVWVASQVSGTVVAYENYGAQTSFSLTPGGFPAGVCVAENGHVYVTQTGVGGVFHCAANGTAPTVYAVGTNPAGIAVDGDGNLWVTDAGAPSYYKVSPTGTVLLTVTPNVTTMSIYGGVACNPNGQVWVANFNDNNIYVCDYNGAPASFSPISVSTLYTGPFGVAVDGQGHCWVTYQSGAVLKFDRNSGAVLVSITTGNPAPVGVAVNNFNEVYVANANANTGTVNYYNQNGLLIQATTAGEALFGLAIDGNGDVWATGTQSNKLFKFDRWNLNGLGTFGTGIVPLSLGDFTGYVQGNIFNQQASDDLDSDTYSNASELAAGTNPFDSNSTPVNPRPVHTGVPTVGSTVWTAFRFYNDATLGFAAAASLNLTANPANYIQVPYTALSIPLEHDGLYDYSFTNFWVFQNYGGYLDANGDAYGQIHFPSSFSVLAGTTFYIAFVTLDDNKSMPITTISNNCAITIRP
jgi:sugar lactone lactonase YvrE